MELAAALIVSNLLVAAATYLVIRTLRVCRPAHPASRDERDALASLLRTQAKRGPMRSVLMRAADVIDQIPD